METTEELLMVRFISSVNQILLAYCFLQMMLADFFRTETEADYLYQEGDDDERTLMVRAEPLSNLLPALSVLTLGCMMCFAIKTRFPVFNR